VLWCLKGTRYFFLLHFSMVERSFSRVFNHVVRRWNKPTGQPPSHWVILLCPRSAASRNTVRMVAVPTDNRWHEAFSTPLNVHRRPPYDMRADFSMRIRLRMPTSNISMKWPLWDRIQTYCSIQGQLVARAHLKYSSAPFGCIITCHFVQGHGPCSKARNQMRYF